MKAVKLVPLHKNINVKNTNEPVHLSSQRRKEIEDFWREVNRHENFHCGEVFNIKSITENDDEYRILLNTTDYAHYIHTVRNDINDDEGCRIIFGAGLVETADSKFIFGEMAAHTAYPGRLQCAGGGLSIEDSDGDHFNIRKSVLRETEEELGINAEKHVLECRPLFIETDGIHGFFVVLYYIKINISEHELLDNYEKFIGNLEANGELPEFRNIIGLANDEADIDSFFKNDERSREDYLEPLLKTMATCT